jgi:peptide/nickel transport system ATP-binding protein
MRSNNTPLLQVDNLSVSYKGIPAVQNVSFELSEGEVLGIVGESGSGKSTVLRSLIRLLDSNGEVTGGHVLFHGEDLLLKSHARLQQLRGNALAMIFQYPELALDPLVKIEHVFRDCIHFHDKTVSKESSRAMMLDILERLNFDCPERVASSYPFELSGGMCQRVTIGMTMMTKPKLLLADEPTSALDVSSQLQVIEELEHIIKGYHTSLLLVTHNMGLVAKLADNIGVMFRGHLVEYGPKSTLLSSPMHPYTRALVASVPAMDGSLPCMVPYSHLSVIGSRRIPCGENHWYLEYENIGQEDACQTRPRERSAQ